MIAGDILHGVACLTLKKKMDAERCIGEKMSLKIGITEENTILKTRYTFKSEETI